MNPKCDQCGYDLSGLGVRGRCPECGHRFNTISQAVRDKPTHPLRRPGMFAGQGLTVVLGAAVLVVLAIGGLLALRTPDPAWPMVTASVMALVLAMMAVWSYLASKSR